jgi:hypothetical protein
VLKTGDFIRITASNDPLFGESLVGSICEVLGVSANGQDIDVLANGRVSATLSVSDGTTWEMADICEVTDARMLKVARPGFNGSADAGAPGLRHLPSLSPEVLAVPVGEQYVLIVEMNDGDIRPYWEAQQDLIDCQRPYPQTQQPCPPHILPFLHAWLDGDCIIFNDSVSVGGRFETDFEICDDAGRALLQECLECARACGWKARVTSAKGGWG